MKNYKLAIFIMSLLGVVAGYGIVYPEKIGLCALGNNTCIYSFPVFTLGHPLFFLSLSIFAISIVLYFVRDEIFKAWGKFAAVFIPLSIVLVYLAPIQSSDWIFPLDKKLAASLLARLFFLLSLLIIAIKSGRLRKTAKA